ncbi:MAG TPA: hypothetical protein VLX59_15270 [Acidimicrobiales bacterium]|nr:hypothetical protein [Acidimicrobiales bacterium]
MGIMDSAKGLMEKGKELVGKTIGGHKPAQTTAPAPDATTPGGDSTSTSNQAGSDAPTVAGSEPPVEPTVEG